MFWVSVLTGQDLCAFGWDGVDACLTSEPDCCLILCKANTCQKLHRRSAARQAVLFPVLDMYARVESDRACWRPQVSPAQALTRCRLVLPEHRNWP